MTMSPKHHETSPEAVTDATTDSDVLQTADLKRRRVIGGLGAAAVWQTPVIASLALPAHAQTSPVLPGAGASSSTSSTSSSGSTPPGSGASSSTGGSTSSTSSTGGSTSSSTGGSTSSSSTSSSGSSSSSGGSGTNTCGGGKGEIVVNTAFHEFSDFGEGRDNFGLSNSTQYDVTNLQFQLSGPQASFFNLSGLPSSLDAGTNYSSFGIAWTGEDCGSLAVKAIALLTITGESCGETVSTTMDVFANCS